MHKTTYNSFSAVKMEDNFINHEQWSDEELTQTSILTAEIWSLGTEEIQVQHGFDHTWPCFSDKTRALTLMTIEQQSNMDSTDC